MLSEHLQSNKWTIDWQHASANLSREKLIKIEAELAATLDPAFAMLSSNVPGHSIETRELMSVHDGRNTAEWIVLRCLLYGPTPEEKSVLKALAALQVTDKENPYFGCSRWYAEETEIHDTNAAFFIGRLLTIRWLLDPGDADLRCYLERTAFWLAHECSKPILFYPNKIISDGCLSLALGNLFDNPALKNTAELFLERWCTYTETRGWGWGENLSIGYTTVILDALWLAFHFLHHNNNIRKRLLSLHNELIENLIFHAPQKMVPAIRSYNFDGDTLHDGGIYSVLGISCDSPVPTWISALLRMMSGADINASISTLINKRATIPVRQRNQRIFDDTEATTYIEGDLRLGTVSRFPVMPGCYSGLGWQSMPAAFMVTDKNYGYLQWETLLADDTQRTHPAASYHTGYAATTLFAEKKQPEIITVCKQHNRTSIIVRSILHLTNVARLIADQWCIPAFNGECRIEGNNIKQSDTACTTDWVLLHYPAGTIAIHALQPILYGVEEITSATVNIFWKDETLILRQILQKGPTARLEQDRMESGWVVTVIPESSVKDAMVHLAKYRIKQEWKDNGELPRQPWQSIRATHVTGPGLDLKIDVDPWRYPRT